MTRWWEIATEGQAGQIPSPAKRFRSESQETWGFLGGTFACNRRDPWHSQPCGVQARPGRAPGLERLPWRNGNSPGMVVARGRRE